MFKIKQKVFVLSEHGLFCEGTIIQACRDEDYLYVREAARSYFTQQASYIALPNKRKELKLKTHKILKSSVYSFNMVNLLYG